MNLLDIRLAESRLNPFFELAHPIGVPHPVSAGENTKTLEVSRDMHTGIVERAAQPDRAGVGDPIGLDLATDTAFDFIRITVRIITAQRVEVGQSGHCEIPLFGSVK